MHIIYNAASESRSCEDVKIEKYWQMLWTFLTSNTTSEIFPRKTFGIFAVNTPGIPV